MSRRTALGITCLAIGFSACAPAREPPARGSLAPDFDLATLDGGHARLSSYRGRVVLIDFWATFCKPCVDSMPHLNALFQRYERNGFVVLGVSIDEPDSLDDVRALVSQTGVAFPILLDPRTRVIAEYSPEVAAPYGVVVGRDGSIAAKHSGEADPRDVEREIQAALGH